MFISGYSFVNLLNIVDYNLPFGKSTSNSQTSSRLIKMSKKEFGYRKLSHSQHLYKQPDPSEYRSDVSKGFHFGFELRAFDNFEVEHLQTLIELLFLLADQIHDSGIDRFPDNPFDNRVLNKETLHLLSNGWNTSIHLDYLELLETNLKITLPNSIKIGNDGPPTAYSVINCIYTLLQRKFLSFTGSGKTLISVGHYSRFLINRPHDGDFPQSIPNINRRSWETAFYELAWKPGGNLQKRVRRAVKLSRSRSDLKNSLSQTLGSEYRYKINDIIYALDTLGII
jgi:hypothetical protein